MSGSGTGRGCDDQTDGAMSDSSEDMTQDAVSDSNSTAGFGAPVVATSSSGRVRAGPASQLSEYSFRLAIERVVCEGIVAWDLEGRQTYVSDAFCDLVGWREEELVGARPPFVYWPDEEADEMAAAFRQILDGDAPPDGFTLRFQRADGQRVHVLVASTPLVANDGSTQGRLASVVEIAGTQGGDSDHVAASHAEKVPAFRPA